MLALVLVVMTLRIFVLISCLLISGTAFSQPQPQAPQVKPPQQAESATKNKEKANDQETGAAEPPITHQPNPSNDLKGDACDDCKKRNEEIDSEFWTVFGHRVKITDSLLAAFTGLLAVVTGGLIAIGVFQWLLSRETARKELRAYMGVERIRLMEEGRGSRRPGLWKIKIRNFGKTMAKDTEVWIAGASGDGTGDFPLGDRRSKTVVMPNEAMGFEDSVEMEDSKIDWFKPGLVSVYVWGKITYRDVFDKPRSTIFRFKSGKVTYSAESGLCEWKVRTDGEGANDAD